MISESSEDDCWNPERVGHHDELKAVVLLQTNIGDQQGGGRSIWSGRCQISLNTELTI